jgi:drug/metabolite transporter (DMT)-like permease
LATVVALALSASLFYGASDFLGALTARRLTVIKSSTVIFLAATGVVAVALLVTTWNYSDQAFWAGTLAGVTGTVGMVTFYAALAIGPMGLLAPLIALIQTSIPVIIAAALGQSLPPIAWFAIGLALLATTLISVPAKTASGNLAIQRITLRGGLLGLISGVTLGFAVVFLDAAPPDSGVFSVFVDMVVGLVIVLPFVVLRRFRTSDDWLHGAPALPLVPEDAPKEPVGAGTWALSAVSGALLGIGNILLIIALHTGNLAVVAVLVSLYPLATVFLAWALLKERMSLPQMAGVALAITAAILLGTS